MKTLKYIGILCLVALIFGTCTHDHSGHGHGDDRESIDESKLMSYDTRYEFMTEGSKERYDKEFIGEIMDMAKSGDYLVFADEEKTVPLEKRDIEVIFMPVSDTFFRTDDQGNVLEATPFTRQLKMEDVQSLRFVESWEHDKKAGTFEKRVVAIAPGVSRYDDKGDYLGVERLFWIYLN